MLKMKRITEAYDMKVFSDTGEYFGDVEECMLSPTKIVSWRIKSTRNSFLSKTLTNAKGVIVPHQMVKSIGDVMIISKAAVPTDSAPEPEAEDH